MRAYVTTLKQQPVTLNATLALSASWWHESLGLCKNSLLAHTCECINCALAMCLAPPMPPHMLGNKSGGVWAISVRRAHFNVSRNVAHVAEICEQMRADQRDS